jgi:hypothetical protein
MSSAATVELESVERGLVRRAVFSAEVGPGYFYRYRLEREWDAALGKILWIMMNPSIASHLIDDATIRRCIGFARDHGKGGIVVVNMFAWISKNPKDLSTVSDPVGPDNLEQVLEAIRSTKTAVAAWGVLKHPLPKQVATMIGIIQEECPNIKCLGTTKDGHPKHPLYLSGECRLIPWAT